MLLWVQISAVLIPRKLNERGLQNNMASPYIQAVQDALPSDLKTSLVNLPEDLRSLLDTVLRFTSGGDCPPDASETTKRQWTAQQLVATQALKQLHPQTNGKRAREDQPSDDEHTSKKSRTTPPPPVGEPDAPLYTLHALSISTPLRKKLDIRIHERTLQLINPSTQAVELSVSMSSLKRAFLLPTRGKTKPHWTVILLSSDTPAPTGKAAAAAANAKENTQIVFGVDAAPPAYTTTDHTADSPSQESHAKGTPILPFLRAFLSHLPIPLTEPDTSVFRSVTSTDANGGAVAGVQAYRSAKEGTLWFLPGGILWDGKPCEYWSTKDLVPGTNAAGEAGTGSDGVRLVSATGRTCSVFIRRRIHEDVTEAQGEDEDEDEEIKCVETDFSMVDGKEQDGITQWVKRHKHLFGKDEPQVGYGIVNGKVDLKGKGKAVAPPQEDSEDEEDSDFVDDSDSDGGSASSDSGSEEDGDGEEGDGGSGDEAEGEDDEDEDEDMDEEAELDPARHPLLRPGAMPRMSKAAMEAAVGIVMEDMVGGSGSQSRGKGKGKRAEEPESEDDELED